MQQHVLSILVSNNSGVLAKIAGLFSKRGYNIDSLSVGTTESEEVSRITITTNCDEDIAEQIKNQIEKLIDTIKVIELMPYSSVHREIALIKVEADKNDMQAISNIVNIFRANIIDVCESSVIIEVTGDENKINAMIKAVKSFGIKEIARTGITGLDRGSN